MAQTILDGNLIPIVGSFQQVLGAVAATGLPTIPTDATKALISVVTQDIRWRDDGTNPTAAIGQRIPADKELLYEGKLSTFRFIEVGATTEVNVSYYKQ